MRLRRSYCRCFVHSGAKIEKQLEAASAAIVSRQRFDRVRIPMHPARCGLGAYSPYRVSRA